MSDEDVIRRYLLRYGDSEAQLAALDSLTSELAIALASNQIQYEAANKAEAENTTLRQRAERYEKVLQEVAAASIAVVSADELQDIAAAALQDSKETRPGMRRISCQHPQGAEGWPTHAFDWVPQPQDSKETGPGVDISSAIATFTIDPGE